MSRPRAISGATDPWSRALLMVAICALGAHQGCAGPERQRPSVVLIVVDTLRQDHLGCYGMTRNTSPAIDALARDAVRFQRAYATAPWTMPSVASMFTGLYPSSHTVMRLAGRLPESALTLAEILKEEDYATGGVVSHLLLYAKHNFHQGFDEYHEKRGNRGNGHLTTGEVTAQAREMVRRFAMAGRPFFLFVHYFDPHYDYKRHPEYGYASADAGRLDGSESIHELRDMMGDMTGEEIQFIQDLYDEEIRHTDAGVGRLLETLRELDLYEESVIILTSDHGEEFLTHGWLGHTRSLYEELVHVPLIIREPGKGRGVRQVEEVVSLVALTPTVLELIGVDSARFRFQAGSLAPSLAGDVPAGNGMAFSEVDFVPRGGRIRKQRPWAELKRAHKQALATAGHKVIFDAPAQSYEIYDLEADPRELEDLAPGGDDAVERLVPLLKEQIEAAAELLLEADEVSLSDQEIERLQSLGYID